MSRDRGSLPERLSSQFAADFLLCHYESGQPERARTSVSYLPKGCTSVHQLHIWLPKQFSLASPGRSLPCAAPLAEVMDNSLYLERGYEQLWGHFSSKSLSEELQIHFCQESALCPEFSAPATLWKERAKREGSPARASTAEQKTWNCVLGFTQNSIYVSRSSPFVPLL